MRSGYLQPPLQVSTLLKIIGIFDLIESQKKLLDRPCTSHSCSFIRLHSQYSELLDTPFIPLFTFDRVRSNYKKRVFHAKGLLLAYGDFFVSTFIVEVPAKDVVIHASCRVIFDFNTGRDEGVERSLCDLYVRYIDNCFVHNARMRQRESSLVKTCSGKQCLNFGNLEGILKTKQTRKSSHKKESL